MNKTIIKFAVSGAYGRMGKNIIQNIQKTKNIALTLAIVKKIKNDILIKKNKSIKIVENIKDIKNEKNIFDVLIDFSNPKTTLKNLEFCKIHNKKIIIGTTGFNKQEIQIIKHYSQYIGIVFSSNFSIGINVIFKLLEKITNILDSSYNIEIIEAHHKNKLDSPSGTALKLGEIISKKKGWNINTSNIYRKNTNTDIRENNKIGFSIIRGGDIIGEHTVMFAGIGERIEITHKASNRNAFSKGAIKAASWIYHKKSGLYNMIDVLNI